MTFSFYAKKIQHECDIDKTRLREQFLNVIGVNHYSIRTEKTYWYWIRYFLRYHRRRHPLEMGPAEVSEFLTWLALSLHPFHLGAGSKELFNSTLLPNGFKSSVNVHSRPEADIQSLFVSPFNEAKHHTASD
ncbi:MULTISPECIES: site-specific integrase [Pseudomonas]|uniref:site-specific integrase n=1 Tax=Pseudomonas TaxID=286 RepID=UPI001C4345A3|nr:MULTISPECIES: site-specific integrase [Pseudomonas]